MPRIMESFLIMSTAEPVKLCLNKVEPPTKPLKYKLPIANKYREGNG